MVDLNLNIDPLISAIENNNYGLVKQLLDNHANPNQKDNNGHPPLLHLLTKMGIDSLLAEDQLILALLIKYGADINISIEEGSLLNYFCASNIPKLSRIIELLVTNGANINARGNEGMTPLMQAANDGNVALVELLLKWEANGELTNDAGMTAYLLAKNAFCKAALSAETSISQRTLEVKALAHRFGLNLSYDLNGSSFSLLGMSETATKHWMKELSESIEKYSLINPIPDPIKEAIKKAIENRNRPTSELLEDFPDKPIVLATEWSSYETCDIIYGNLYVQINRAQRDQEAFKNADFYIYLIQSNEKIPEYLEKLQANQGIKTLSIDHRKQFLTEAAHELLNLKQIDHVDLQEPKVGNCSWTSPKGALASLIYIYCGMGKTGEFNSSLAKIEWTNGYALYKNWLEWDREVYLTGFLDKCRTGEIQLSPADLKLLLFIFAEFNGSDEVGNKIFGILNKHQNDIDWAAKDLDGADCIALCNNANHTEAALRLTRLMG